MTVFSALFGILSLRSRRWLSATAPVLRSLLLVCDGEHADVGGHQLEDDLEREAVRDGTPAEQVFAELLGK